MDSVYMFRQLRGPSKTVVCREQSRRAAMEASSSASVETAKVVVESVKVGVVIVAGAWAYFRFFAQRTFAPMFKASFRCKVHGQHSNKWLVQFKLPMRNLGRVRITVHRISLQVCGLKRDGTLPENGPELVLPDILYNVDNMVSKNVFEYLEPKIMLTRSFLVPSGTWLEFSVAHSPVT
jgi:hypothetical protein